MGRNGSRNDLLIYAIALALTKLQWIFLLLLTCLYLPALAF